MSGVTKAVRRTVLSVVRRAPVPAVQLPDHATILSAMPVAVVVLSEENRFTYANPAAEQFLGLSVSQLAQLSLSDVLPEDSPLFLMLNQLRTGANSIADHDLSFEGPRIRKTGISVQGTTVTDDGATPRAASPGWRPSWRMRSRTRSPASEGPRSCWKAASPSPTASSPCSFATKLTASAPWWTVWRSSARSR
jgi:PAS domain S-box-containing protein